MEVGEQFAVFAEGGRLKVEDARFDFVNWKLKPFCAKRTKGIESRDQRPSSAPPASEGKLPTPT